MESTHYCKKCILKENSSNVILDKNGLCQYCNGNETRDSNTKRYRSALKGTFEFERYVRKSENRGLYDDCMVMLSGGKDSIYILKNLVKKFKLHPLAFTVNNPFESPNAKKNIEKTLSKLNVEHMMYSPNASLYKKMMGKILTYDTEKISQFMRESGNPPEQIPCIVCTSYMQIIAYLTAARLGIKYILYCASPKEIEVLDFDIEVIIKRFIKICGKELAEEMFNGELKAILNQESDKLPQIIFPYASMPQYNAEKIISELKAEGLYESTPIETHCSLIGILNYFSYQKFNCYYYAADTAVSVRQGELDREEVLFHMQEYKDMVYMIAAEEKMGIEEKKLVKKKLALPDYIMDRIIHIRSTAEELGIKLEDII